MSIHYYDNGGVTMDRYTVLDYEDNAAYGMSSDPTSPAGFNQYLGRADEMMPEVCGTEVQLADLPEVVQQAIAVRLMSEE